jgi:tRNA (adenine57-N1/adenine58-N1)-methyltransferase
MLTNLSKSMALTIKDGDLVVLVNEKGGKILFFIEDKIKRIKGLGVYNPKELIDINYNQKIQIGNKDYIVFEPSINDMLSTLERKAQIILPKDGMFIIYYCDIKSGDTVLEGGAGSGALTILLANIVKPEGKIISYEKRDDHIKVVKRNLKRSGLYDFVDLKKGDVTQEIPENNVDAVVLDIPNPWDALENGYSALRPGGHLASYSPTMNQFEKTTRAMEDQDFREIKTIETLQREMIVGERGVRPSFDNLGHTGYLTFARKII